MDYRSGKWADAILSRQMPDGSWGCFHTLRTGSAIPMTTEQALTRLERLGFTINDSCIQRTVGYMKILLEKRVLPEGMEKSSDFATFVDLILSARIRRFTGDCLPANQIAERWAAVVTAAFAGDGYDDARYRNCYQQQFGRAPWGDRLADFVSYYQLSLLRGMLDIQTESRMLDYVLHHESGIYYIYGKCLEMLPAGFAGRSASRYLTALELLADYPSAGQKLQFAADWIWKNRGADGSWDLGQQAKDGVCFPLSDDWRTVSRRKADCTERVAALLDKLDTGRRYQNGI